MGSNLTIDKILTAALQRTNQQCKELTQRQTWELGLHCRTRAFVTEITWPAGFSLHCGIPGFQHKPSSPRSTVKLQRV